MNPQTVINIFLKPINELPVIISSLSALHSFITLLLKEYFPHLI